MRPLVLEMEGFAAFRATTVIDFRQHDLIAFTGPTGAGKSTIIDGIVFALYGSVARYENEKLVAPIINAVSTEARVRLFFAIGEVEYTAVRVVRRTNTGASTKEARLERGDEVLASTAQDVTNEIEALLGLSFSQFTKTVVLPQGDFARFLTEKAGARQALLRRLLGLEVFVAVGKAARKRSRDLHAQAQAFERATRDGAVVSEHEIHQLSKAVADLDEALTELADATDAFSEAQSTQVESKASLAILDGHLEALASLAVPGDTRTFATQLSKAEVTLAAAHNKLDAAAAKLAIATDNRDALPTSAELSESLSSFEELAVLTDQVKALDSELDEAAKGLALATTGAEGAASALRTADDALERARTLAGARGIAATLHAGDECPVCEQTVDQLPKHTGKDHGAANVKKAEREREDARSHAKQAVEAVQIATATHADVNARLANARETHEVLDEALSAGPTQRQLIALAKKALTLDDKVTIAATVVDDAETRAAEAQDAVDSHRENASAMRRQFTEARDTVAALGPPRPSEDSLSDDWTALVSWSKVQAKETKLERKDSAATVKRAAKNQVAAEQTMLRLSSPFFAPGAEPDARKSAAVLRNAHADARVVLANAEDRRARQVANKVELVDIDKERRIADEVGKHFVSGMFERWILADVMADLAERASARLLTLSGGAYSLTTDGRDFQIRDHRNADELRGARTLSGGETFLTSLSLALALAESITELATSVTPPLESMFLDEGFGALDPETLDTVAAAIEELGASGRLIGVVTHIRELADRIPTRFDVQRSPSGSTVTAPT